MAFAFDTKVELAPLPNTCELKFPEDWDVVSQALESFHKVHLCARGPARSKFPSVHPECAYIDKTGVWSHSRCTLVEQGRKQWNSCDSSNNVLFEFIKLDFKSEGRNRGYKSGQVLPKRLRLCS